MDRTGMGFRPCLPCIIKTGQMNKRSRFPRIFFLLLLFGMLNLLTMLGNPAWAQLRNVDLVRLLGTGMCFGAALVAGAAYFMDRRVPHG